MQQAEPSPSDELKRVGRRFAYGLAIAINIAILVIVQNLTSWDVLPFITSDFDSVVPWISFSLVVTILANAVYMAADDAAVRAGGDVITNLASLLATWQVFVVYPFDFSQYEFAWDFVARLVLVVAIVGTIAGAIVAMTKLARAGRPQEGGGHDVVA